MATEDVTLVRLLIADNGAEQLLTDENLSALLDLYGDVRRAAARALRVIAASEVLVSKKIRTQDLSTDGPAVAAELRAQADNLDAEAELLEAAEDVGFFEVTTFGEHPPVEGEEVRW